MCQFSMRLSSLGGDSSVGHHRGRAATRTSEIVRRAVPALSKGEAFVKLHRASKALSIEERSSEPKPLSKRVITVLSENKKTIGAILLGILTTIALLSNPIGHAVLLGLGSVFLVAKKIEGIAKKLGLAKKLLGISESKAEVTIKDKIRKKAPNMLEERKEREEIRQIYKTLKIQLTGQEAGLELEDGVSQEDLLNENLIELREMIGKLQKGKSIPEGSFDAIKTILEEIEESEPYQNNASEADQNFVLFLKQNIEEVEKNSSAETKPVFVLQALRYSDTDGLKLSVLEEIANG